MNQRCLNLKSRIAFRNCTHGQLIRYIQLLEREIMILKHRNKKQKKEKGSNG